jgi:hypothetical protein
MRLSKRIWDLFLASEQYELHIFKMWIDSEGSYLDISEGIMNAKPGQDTEFVELPDRLLLPCNKNDSPTMGRKPDSYIFNEEGLKWLETRLTCSADQKAWRIKEGGGRAKSWWKRHAKALAKLKKVIADEEARAR